MASHPVGQDTVVGQTLGHYRIAEKIGAGGMGEVYRAHDEHLDREVAIKVLSAGTLSDELSRKRFRKEAIALSKLNHPNVATIHDFDSQQGVDFLVMEYIPGITLSEKLARRPLPEKEVVTLGAQLAEGLSAAHGHGVVHRDLKPGNLRLTDDGRLKILDFGLAKLWLPVTASAATESLSETQAMAGTLPYMAPEQLLGERIDARTDLHAAGLVLYEMATGRYPFADVENSQLIGAILHRPPRPLTTLNSRLSPELERIIGKCLEKEPENRYQSAKELAIDLRRLQTGVVSAVPPAVRPAKWSSAKSVGLGLGILASVIVLLIAFDIGHSRDRLLGRADAPHIESLAVLPLTNLSGDPQQEYFSDGMTEELITDLGKIAALRVISRTSVMQYKQTKKTLPTIAQELNVDAVVEGSVLRSGNRVRITAQLVQAKAERHLWAESYERDLSDILALQSEVARAIANEIKIKVTPQEQTHLASARSVNPEAYDAYLKAKSYAQMSWGRGLPEAKTAIAYIQRAIDLDPTYAPAYVLLSEVYDNEAWNDLAPAKEVVPSARAAVETALRLDPMVAEGHAELGNMKSMVDWDWAGAEQELKRSLMLDPNSSDAHLHYGFFLTFMGRGDESVRETQKGIELDPLSRPASLNLGWVLYFARRHDESIAQIKKVLEVTPDFAYGDAFLAANYAQKGMYPEATAACHGAIRAMAEDQRMGRRYPGQG